MGLFGKYRYSVDELFSGIIKKERLTLSKAITLIESKRHDDMEQSALLLDKIMPYANKSIRIGITGVPGVGKSSFIEVFGSHLTSLGKRIAILSIDPSSVKSKGSILGDKTRMENLSHDPNAFIRPSPAGSSLGGVTTKTRETILLCEAAGYDIIIVETVGVGQSETAVKDMVDFFLLLMLSGGGDELQGIKRGIMEMADLIAINKADGQNMIPAQKTKKILQNAVHLFPPLAIDWTVPVTLCSAYERKGVDEIWHKIEEYLRISHESGFFQEYRQEQNTHWFRSLVNEQILSNYLNKERLERLVKIEKQVRSNNIGVRLGLRKFFDET